MGWLVVGVWAFCYAAVAAALFGQLAGMSDRDDDPPPVSLLVLAAVLWPLSLIAGAGYNAGRRSK